MKRTPKGELFQEQIVVPRLFAAAKKASTKQDAGTSEQWIVICIDRRRLGVKWLFTVRLF